MVLNTGIREVKQTGKSFPLCGPDFTDNDKDGTNLKSAVLER